MVSIRIMEGAQLRLEGIIRITRIIDVRVTIEVIGSRIRIIEVKGIIDIT
jgi:hypothetical protein